MSREGPLATLEIVHRLGRCGVQVWSYQEPWTEAGGELLDLLLAIAGWVALMGPTSEASGPKQDWPGQSLRERRWDAPRSARTNVNEAGGDTC